MTGIDLPAAGSITVSDLIGGAVVRIPAEATVTGAAQAIIKAGGKVFAEVDLAVPRVVEVPGPLGSTRIEVQPGRARVAADPGPRQYCVRQGWLTSAGAVASCAPNQVSLALSGRNADYDSLNY